MRGTRRVAAVALALIIGGVLALPALAQSPASSPTSPVNLATRVDFGVAKAAHQAIVTAGDARFEVLGDGLIRMEYSPSGTFEDALTVNVLNRRFAVPFYRVSSSGRLADNQDVGGHASLPARVGAVRPGQHLGAGVPGASAVSPQWQNECPFNQVCDAGAAQLVGPANIQTDHSGYQSIAGFIANLGQGNQAGANWTVLGAPAGQAVVTLRYANYIGALGGPASRTIDLVVNGSDVQTLTLPAHEQLGRLVNGHGQRQPERRQQHGWCRVRRRRQLQRQRRHPVGLGAERVAAGGAGYELSRWLHPRFRHRHLRARLQLSGWHADGRTVHRRAARDAPGHASTRPATACSTTPTARHRPRRPLGRSANRGRRHRGGRRSVRLRTRLRPGAAGPQSPHRPLAIAARVPVRRVVLAPSRLQRLRLRADPDPAFRASHVPLDTLSVDTNWKSPNDWDGLEWNPALFPDPQGFLTWAATQGIHVSAERPRAALPTTIPSWPPHRRWPEPHWPITNSCFTPSGTCKVWDWSSIPQAESYFALHQPFESQGVSLLVARLVLRQLDRVETRA